MKERRAHLNWCHVNQGLDDKGWDRQEEIAHAKALRWSSRTQRRPVWLGWGK